MAINYQIIMKRQPHNNNELITAIREYGSDSLFGDDPGFLDVGFWGFSGV